MLVKHKPTGQRANPQIESAVYLTALANSELRNNLIGALFADDRAVVKSTTEAALDAKVQITGFWLGFAVFCALGFAIYWAFEYLSRRLDEEWATIVTYVPAFFAFLVIFPVQRWYSTYAKRRYCEEHGHVLEQFKSAAGRHVVLCRRCFSVLQGPPVS